MNFLLLAVDELSPDTIKLGLVAALFGLGLLGMKYKKKVEAWVEEKKYTISKNISKLEGLGCKRITEVGRRALAEQYPEAFQELSSLADDLMEEGGLLKVTGPIAVQNLPALLMHPEFGSQILDQIVDTMPKLLRERPEAWDKIQLAIKQGQKIHDDTVLERAEQIQRQTAKAK